MPNNSETVVTSTEATDLHYYEAGIGLSRRDFAELWRYRELVLVLAIRDLKVRYRQAIVGVAWVLIQPVAMVLMFSLLFYWLDRKPTSQRFPYVLSAYAGTVVWQFVAYVVRESSDSLVSNRHLITKVYFPRIALPLATVLCGLVDFVIAFLGLVAMLVYFRVSPGLTIFAMPLFMLLGVAVSFAVGLWFSAFNALYRDVRHVVPFVIQIGFLASPVMYETQSLIPQDRQWLYGLNPIVTVIDGFRWSVFATDGPKVEMIGISIAVTAGLLISGFLYFCWVEQRVADRI